MRCVCVFNLELVIHTIAGNYCNKPNQLMKAVGLVLHSNHVAEIIRQPFARAEMHTYTDADQRKCEMKYYRRSFDFPNKPTLKRCAVCSEKSNGIYNENGIR